MEPLPLGKDCVAEETPQPGKTTEAAKAEPAKPPAHAAHKKEEPKPPAAPRSPVEQWLDAYLPATLAGQQPKNFRGTMAVKEFIPQIRLVLERQRPLWLGAAWQAAGAILAGALGAGLAWTRLAPGPLRGGAAAAAALLFLFGLARLVRPPLMGLRLDSMVTRLTLTTARGAATEMSFAACDYLELDEQRWGPGFRYRVRLEPRWGGTLSIAVTETGARTTALLNAVELVRPLAQILRIPVRVRVSRLALGAPLELPPVPAVKATAAEEEAPPAAKSS